MSLEFPPRDLVKYALSLAEGAAIEAAREPFARLLCLGAITALIAVFGIAVVACTLAALWIYALPTTGATGASLIVAGVLVILCLVGCVAFWYKRKPPTVPLAAAPFALSTADAIRLINDHKVMAMAAALLTGFVAGSNRK